MAIVNRWGFLRRGEGVEAVLDDMRQAYAQKRNASHIMELGVAYLWLKRYAEASRHFEAAISTYPRAGDSFFAMAGVAKLCAGDAKGAIPLWRAGLLAKYADGAGGVSLPLLLFAMSVIYPYAFAKAEARSILGMKTRDVRVSNWPGPIGEFLLGRVDQAALMQNLTGVNDGDTALRKWQAHFYFGVAKLERGDQCGFKQAMRENIASALDESRPEDFLTGCLWQPEFFIARRETSPA